MQEIILNFSTTILQEEEIREKAAKIEYAEQCLTTIKSELKVSLHTFRTGCVSFPFCNLLLASQLFELEVNELATCFTTFS